MSRFGWILALVAFLGFFSLLAATQIARDAHTCIAFCWEAQANGK